MTLACNNCSPARRGPLFVLVIVPPLPMGNMILGNWKWSWAAIRPWQSKSPEGGTGIVCNTCSIVGPDSSNIWMDVIEEKITFDYVFDMSSAPIFIRYMHAEGEEVGDAPWRNFTIPRENGDQQTRCLLGRKGEYSRGLSSMMND